MKIGEFSKVNNVSIDTIRHYISLKLITPQKSGIQYVFDDVCQKELNNILKLKNLGFTLNEIKNISFYQSLGKLDNFESYEGYLKIFNDKYQSLQTEISKLQEYEKRLKIEVDTMEKSKNKKRSIKGIPLNLINLFSCVECNSNLDLAHGIIENNFITQGILKCTCGEEYVIKDGILITDSANVNYIDLNDKNIIDDYIESTDKSYISNLKNNCEWIKNKASNIPLNNKTILEIGSGYGFLLRIFSENLARDSVYIAVDNNINKHIFLKELVDNANESYNVVFICTDFERIPIKKDSVDILLDCAGSSNYWFENNKFTLDFINPFMKDKSFYLASYILFNKLDRNNFIKAENRVYFKYDSLKKKLNNSIFTISDSYKSEILNKPGIYEDYFNDNEEVFSYVIFGERLG